MNKKINNPVNLNNCEEIETFPGIFRTTLAYNKEIMLCNFRMLKGSKVQLHNHPNVQIGYVISGKIRFFTENSDFIVNNGDSYVFGMNEKHGAEIREDSVVIEVFAPYRPEYINLNKI